MEFSSLASLGTPPFYIVANFTRFVKGAVLFLPPILGGATALAFDLIADRRPNLEEQVSLYQMLQR